MTRLWNVGTNEVGSESCNCQERYTRSLIHSNEIPEVWANVLFKKPNDSESVTRKEKMAVFMMIRELK